MKAVLITGGFDPLHSGHIAYMKEAKKLGDVLIVGVNSDDWLTRKKNQPFMSWNERATIIQELSCVDEVISFDDSDGTAIDAIKKTASKYNAVVFANGGDRSDSNIPEMDYFDDNVSFVFGVGGETKQNSSSKILSEWKNPKTYRQWGYYRVLHSDGPETKVKELIVNPNESLSLQRHQFRAEHWIVSNGTATVKVGSNDLQTVVLNKHEEIHIPLGYWHQLINNTDDELRIVEIQYGKICIEEDIERL
jgi:cytidyltransferase-like protein